MRASSAGLVCSLIFSLISFLRAFASGEGPAGIYTVTTSQAPSGPNLTIAALPMDVNNVTLVDYDELLKEYVVKKKSNLYCEGTH